MKLCCSDEDVRRDALPTVGKPSRLAPRQPGAPGFICCFSTLTTDTDNYPDLLGKRCQSIRGLQKNGFRVFA
ncbi:MAG: hypothetical protein QOI53_2838 [Verrucomicrobiota bacterium]|jgi:hypothetical protein|nr:hypothetical protein [Verrucomicrobiota bacterium]